MTNPADQALLDIARSLTATGQLDEPAYQALWLWVEGHSFRSIASIQDVAGSTAHSRVERATRTLTNHITKEAS